jgi:uncharacterized protein YndB with AHSA1/START domain
MTHTNQTSATAEPGKQDLFIHRTFDAPREMVFKAFTQPELLLQWLYQGRKIDFMDCKTRGAYRVVFPGENGSEIGLYGVFHEVLAPERIIKTFEYEGLPERGHVALEKSVFETLSGEKTRVTIQYICESVHFRDGLLQSGMEQVFAAAYRHLDELLIKGI